MSVLFLTWFRLLRTMFRASTDDPHFRALAASVGLLIVIGTVFYTLNQDWSPVDSFYFTITTLTTVGYGDLAPSGDGAKLATVALQLSGIGLLVLLLAEIARRTVRARETDPDESSAGDGGD